MAGKKQKNIKLYTRSSMIFGRELHAGLHMFAESLDSVEHWLIATQDPLDFNLQEILDNKPDGIVAQVFDAQVLAQIDETGIPWINVGASHADVPAPWITINNDQVGRLAAEDLLERGYEHFGYVENGHIYSSERHAAFSTRLEDEGYSCDRILIPRSIFYHGNIDQMQRVTQDCRDWLKRQRNPLGVLVCNDDCARIIHRACRLAGIQMPQDVGLIGVDNDKAICESCSPMLSSIELDPRAVGMKAGQELHQMMLGKNHSARVHRIDPIGIVTRESTDNQNRLSPTVQRAMAYIRDNAGKGITVHAIAEDLNVSRRQLELKFKQEIEQTPAEALRRARVEQAKLLLRDTDWPTAKIVLEIGLKDISRFIRHFESFVGMKPSEYRKQFRR